MNKLPFNDAEVKVKISNSVALVEICRPPNNFFDGELLCKLASVYESLDSNSDCRAIVLSSEGKHFCAGYQFAPRTSIVATRASKKSEANTVYSSALRLFSTKKPVVAAVQGAAIGGGLGLALSADFRITCPEARFSANFSRLGIHHGFGLSITLPRLIGHCQADLLLMTGRRIDGKTAVMIGLANKLVPKNDVCVSAIELATEIAESAPLAVQAIRETQREDLVAKLHTAVQRELAEQERLKKTLDFGEGVKATMARRQPKFTGE